MAVIDRSIPAHASTHETGGVDPLDGTHGVQAIKLVSGERLYFKNSSGVNIVSFDEATGTIRTKGTTREGVSSV